MSTTLKDTASPITAPSLTEAVIETLPAPVFYKDAAGKYLGCNSAFASFVGRSKEELVGKGVFELFEPDMAQIYFNADQELFAAGGKQVYEARVRYADGSVHDVLFHKAVFSTDEDDLLGMVGVMLDITERKELETSLKNSQALFSQAFRSNPGLIALTNPETGEHLDVNEAWLDALKFNKEDVIGKTGFELEIWANVSDRLRILKIHSKTGKSRNLEATLKAKDGTLVDCVVSTETIHIDNQPLVLWTANNITERKRAEEANEAKTVFLSNMSHEFRTPLNGILGFTQLLKMNKNQNLTDQQMDWVNQINISGGLLLEIVNDVLDLARIESGRIEYTPETFRPREVFKECYDMLKPVADSRNITVKGVPETNRLVHVDRGKLKQVLMNLVGNAVKYNKNNGYVHFGCRSQGEDKVEIYVEDNGLGIPRSELPLIFEPFHRVPDHASFVDGTGIGLSIVKKNVELMGGEITATSTNGEGTCFTITLPAKIDEPDVDALQFDI